MPEAYKGSQGQSFFASMCGPLQNVPGGQAWKAQAGNGGGPGQGLQDFGEDVARVGWGGKERFPGGHVHFPKPLQLAGRGQHACRQEFVQLGAKTPPPLPFEHYCG